MTPRRFFVSALCWLALPAMAGAAVTELSFKESVIEKHARPEDDHLVYQFPFTMTGKRTVTIKEIRALCDCLEITTDRRRYAPGESGVVTAKLQLGSYEGTIAKSFSVITDDPGQQRLLLRCVAHIPEVCTLSTLAVRWKIGAEPTSQRVTMTVTGEKPMKVLNVKSTRENVIASFKEVRPGREYEITLTPRSTSVGQTGLVSIETDSPVKKFSRRLLFFHILPRD